MNPVWGFPDIIRFLRTVASAAVFLIRENFHFCNETQVSTATVGARIITTVYNESEMEELNNA